MSAAVPCYENANSKSQQSHNFKKDGYIEVELLYMPKDLAPRRLRLSLAEGSTIADLIYQSGWNESYPEIHGLKVGIFGIPAALTSLIHTGDRIEIYRPLLLDPKEQRRLRVAKK